MKTLTKIIYRAFALFAFACFSLAPLAQAQSCVDGCGGVANTFQGQGALSANSGGGYNTAFGYRALYISDIGLSNTAIGAGTLAANRSGDYNTATGYQA